MDNNVVDMKGNPINLTELTEDNLIRERLERMIHKLTDCIDSMDVEERKATYGGVIIPYIFDWLFKIYPEAFLVNNNGTIKIVCAGDLQTFLRRNFDDFSHNIPGQNDE